MRYAAIGFAVGLLGALSLAAMPDGDDLKIGVLNLQECFNAERYKWVKEIDGDLKDLVTAHTENLRRLEKKIRVLEEKITGIPKDSDLYLRLAKEHAVAKADLKAADEVGKARYAKEYTRAKTAVFREILRVAAEIGKAKGLDLVLRGEDPSFELEGKGAKDITRLMNRRNVMYSSPRIDITDAVIQKLNEAHEKDGE